MSLEWIRQRLGGRLPKLVFAVDVETTGCHPQSHHVWQLGYALVRDGVVVDSGDHIVNLFADNSLHDEALQMSITKIRDIMEARGHTFDISADRLRAGKHPKLVYDWLVKTCGQVAAKGGWLAGYNQIRFDLPFLEQAAGRWSLTLPDMPCLDALAVERVARYPGDSRLVPRSSEDLHDYQRRITGVRLKGTLVDAVRRLGLEKAAGCRIADAHDARVDAAYAAHVLIHHLHGAGTTVPAVTPVQAARPVAEPAPVEPAAKLPKPVSQKELFPTAPPRKQRIGWR